ncbi:MAG: hypothetical protein ACKVK6_16235 [bacterium]
MTSRAEALKVVARVTRAAVKAARVAMKADAKVETLILTVCQISLPCQISRRKKVIALRVQTKERKVRALNSVRNPVVIYKTLATRLARAAICSATSPVAECLVLAVLAQTIQQVGVQVRVQVNSAMKFEQLKMQ